MITHRHLFFCLFVVGRVSEKQNAAETHTHTHTHTHTQTQTGTRNDSGRLGKGISRTWMEIGMGLVV